jgi:hypothetical protein
MREKPGFSDPFFSRLLGSWAKRGMGGWGRDAERVMTEVVAGRCNHLYRGVSAGPRSSGRSFSKQVAAHQHNRQHDGQG